jgi:hypothetical protein
MIARVRCRLRIAGLVDDKAVAIFVPASIADADG